MSVRYGIILLNQTKGITMNYKVYCTAGNCSDYIVMESYEYGYYQDDYLCASCYDAEEVAFYELTGWADNDALASAGHGMDEDY